MHRQVQAANFYYLDSRFDPEEGAPAGIRASKQFDVNFPS